MYSCPEKSSKVIHSQNLFLWKGVIAATLHLCEVRGSNHMFYLSASRMAQMRDIKLETGSVEDLSGLKCFDSHVSSKTCFLTQVLQ